MMSRAIGAAVLWGALQGIIMNIAIGVVIGLAIAAGVFGLWVLVQYAKGMGR